MKLQKIIKITCLILVIAGLIEIIVHIYKSNQQNIEQQRLSNLYNNDQSQERMTKEDAVVEDISTEPESEIETVPIILDKFTALYEENSDIVGWLSIPDTKIDYPVMQVSDDEDEDYYLHMSFDREEDKYGCLYVRQSADVFSPSTNAVIYGHNMKDGSMFGTLKLYQDEEYYLEHKEIIFDNLYEEHTYEVMSVFFSQVYDEDDEVFKYYKFYQANNEEEFDYFYENIKSLSLYDTGVEATYGDTFITLSTCSYQVEDGRFVVIAKRKVHS